MKRHTFIQKGQVSKLTPEQAEKSYVKLYDLDKHIETIIEDLNVSNYNSCCDSSATTFPVRHNSTLGITEYFNGTTWTASKPQGTVTQATSVSTGVTLSTKAGVITTQAATTAAQASFTFTVTNTLVTTASVINLTALNTGAGIAVVGLNAVPANGSFVVRVDNAHATNAFNSALKIHFNIA